MEFLNNLRRIKEEHPTTFCKFSLYSENRLNNEAFALPVWIEDYFTFEIVPGVSFDAKAISCAYFILLISINGRDNCGNLLTFMMGYVAAETEECDEWVLTAFLACYGVPPKFICLDQAMK